MLIKINEFFCLYTILFFLINALYTNIINVLEFKESFLNFAKYTIRF